MEAHVIQVLRQHRGGVGIVRHVQDDGGLAGQDLKRPGSEACSSPMRTACCGTGSRSRTDSSAASAAEALSS